MAWDRGGLAQLEGLKWLINGNTMSSDLFFTEYLSEKAAPRMGNLAMRASRFFETLNWRRYPKKDPDLKLSRFSLNSLPRKKNSTPDTSPDIPKSEKLVSLLEQSWQEDTNILCKSKYFRLEFCVTACGTVSRNGVGRDGPLVLKNTSLNPVEE